MSKNTEIIVVTISVDGRVSQIAGSLDTVERTIARLEENHTVKIIRREVRLIAVEGH